MPTFQERLQEEWRHLIEGPAPDEKPGGLGTVRFIAWCPANAAQVLEKAKAVLKVVNRHSTGEWPNDDKWKELLPNWFVKSCSPELSQAEAEAELARWRQLPREEQIREEEDLWSLSNWVYWFKPGNRQWYWWDAAVLDADNVVIAIEVEGWPFPWGSLGWLFRVAGAANVKGECD